jgi:hypothetical protein
MKCPKCGLFSPDIAVQCDCGYDFAAGQMIGLPRSTAADDLLAGFFFVGPWLVIAIGSVGSFLALVTEEDLNLFLMFFGAYGIGSIVGLVSVLVMRQKIVALKAYAGFLVGVFGGSFLSAMVATYAKSGHRLKLFTVLLLVAIPPVSGTAAGSWASTRWVNLSGSSSR